MTITRTPLHDAQVCISCGVPATARPLDPSHVIARSQAPDRVNDPTNIVLQCRPEHDLIGAKKARQYTVYATDAPSDVLLYVYERWSEDLCDFEEVTRVRVVVDKKRGHLVPEEPVLSAAAEADDSPFEEGRAIAVRSSAAAPSAGGRGGSTKGKTRKGTGGTGVRVPSAPPTPLDDCCQRLMLLSYQFDRLESATDEWKWQVGECMNDLERIVGAEEVNGYLRGFRKEKTLMQYAWVAAKVTRVIGLSWSHHRAVAALPPSEQQEKLEEAKAAGTPAEGLRLALRAPRERHECPSCGALHQVKA